MDDLDEAFRALDARVPALPVPLADLRHRMRTHRRRRRAGGAAVALGLAGVLAGGLVATRAPSGTSTVTPVESPAVSSPSAATPASCTFTDLQVSVEASNDNEGSLRVYVPGVFGYVRLRNLRAPCLLDDHLDVTLLDEHGRSINVPSTPHDDSKGGGCAECEPPTGPLLLAPGDSAISQFRWEPGYCGKRVTALKVRLVSGGQTRIEPVVNTRPRSAGSADFEDPPCGAGVPRKAVDVTLLARPDGYNARTSAGP